MRINLADPAEFTLENIKKLIASEDDSVHTQFRVTSDNYLFLSKSVGNRDLEGIKFRIETNAAYNGYVGEEAASNNEWVPRIYNVIKKNWENPFLSYSDTF
ncbi:MAG: hypothetical protein IPO02_09785 [Bacteroidetes bacterium]|nr:hypothetical protein [Bacteroidota bacterium]